MTQLSTRTRFARELIPALVLVLVALIAAAAGCGSSSSPSPTPAPIEGVATPSSVAVVTATNAE